MAGAVIQIGVFMKKESNEKIIWGTYRSWKSYYTWFFFVFIWFLLGLMFPAFFLIFIVSVVAIAIHRYSSKYYITNKKVHSIYKFNIGTNKSSFPLREIEEVAMERDLWGELFGYGDVKIGVIGETKVIFRGVRRPNEVVDYFKRRTGNR